MLKYDFNNSPFIAMLAHASGIELVFYFSTASNLFFISLPRQCHNKLFLFHFQNIATCFLHSLKDIAASPLNVWYSTN